MNILFVCKYNRFRSKVAEAVFNALARKRGLKKVKVKSAGVQLDTSRPQISLPAEYAFVVYGYSCMGYLLCYVFDSFLLKPPEE